MAELLWAYGVVPARQGPPAVAGIEGAPVAAVRDGGLAALASPVPAERFGGAELQRRLEDLDALAALARAHDGVLNAAMEAGDVVPFAICTIFATPEAVRGMLAGDADRLASALERVRGMVEWGVKGFAGAPEPVSSGARPSSGTEYLTRRRAEREQLAASSSELESAVAEAHERLARFAAGATLDRPQDRRLSRREAEMVLNGSYLVARERADAFAALVRALAGHHAGLALEITGPWPPYHFVREPRP